MVLGLHCIISWVVALSVPMLVTKDADENLRTLWKAEKNMSYALPRFLDHFSNKGFTFEGITTLPS